MPSASEILANPKIRPITMERVDVVGNRLCMSIDMRPLIKQNPEREFYKDVMEQWPALDHAYQQSLRYYVDDFRRVVTFSSLLTQNKSDNPCVETNRLALGQHVAHISFEAPFGQLHEYTWVFEVKADGIVPEVTATVVP